MFTTFGGFAGATVLLTGVGGEGQVGEAVAQAFADAGAALVLVDRSADKVRARAEALAAAGHSARGYGCDLTDADAVATLAAVMKQAHGDRLEAVVHMAGGFAMGGAVADSSTDVWHQQIAINLTTAYLTARAFVPLLRPARGAMVFFASQAAAPGATGAKMSAYAAAKSGVAALMRAVAAEEHEHGVRANAVAPAAIRTAANVATMGADARYVEREEVAAAVLFLCSAGASAITGQLVSLG
jgi:NAD(P)-dependent dehydrogenase (short-subunit alcohol dehydrogenase family)